MLGSFSTALVALLGVAAPAVATRGRGWGGGWGQAPPFDCPGRPHKPAPVCSPQQSKGWDWTGYTGGYGSICSSYDSMSFGCNNGGSWKYVQDIFSSNSDFAGRGLASRGGGGCMAADLNNFPSYSCSGGRTFDAASFLVVSEIDVDLELVFQQADGTSCSQYSSCSRHGSTIANTQCGNATSVTFKHRHGGGSCGFGVSSVSYASCTSTTTFPPPPPATSTTYSVPSSTMVTTTSSSIASTTSTSTSLSTSTSTSYSTATSTSTSIYTQSTTSVYTTTTPVVSTTTVSSVVTTSSISTSVVTYSTTVTSCGSSITDCPASSTIVTTSCSTSLVTVPVTSTVVSTTVSTSLVTVPVTVTATSLSTATVTDLSTSTAVTVTTQYVTTSTTVCPVTVTQSAGNTTIYSTYMTTSYVPVTVTATTTALSAPPTSSGCPDTVPQCLNTYMYLVPTCKDNTDAACFCANANYTEAIIGCLEAYSGEDASTAIAYLQGICAPHASSNPQPYTGVPSTITVTAPAGPQTTVYITQSGTTSTVTVPAVTFSTPAGPSSSGGANLVPAGPSGSTSTIPIVPAGPSPTGAAAAASSSYAAGAPVAASSSASGIATQSTTPAIATGAASKSIVSGGAMVVVAMLAALVL